ncbi:hypothetical protein MAR_004713 [Mya arenaria]|uniref:Uncharacterized protein n=1 Tax=Mya arenaria TaxID=6604 RepID=A0ABY7EXD4_MYAAR|nr:hypothetical protein MAR_004713 [Mya arenaria]
MVVSNLKPPTEAEKTKLADTSNLSLHLKYYLQKIHIDLISIVKKIQPMKYGFNTKLAFVIINCKSKIVKDKSQKLLREIMTISNMY